jgi:hypothetical protein
MHNRLRLGSAVLVAALAAISCGDDTKSLPEPQKAPADRSGPSSSAPELPVSPPDPDYKGTIPMEVDTTVGNATFKTKGLGECTYADDASIYDVPAAMWHATLRAEGQSVSYVNVTVWQFKDGSPNQVATGVQVGPTFRHISTVKGSARVGKGTARPERSGEAGTIAVEGEDASGGPLVLRVQCARFTVPVEEGGR